MHQLLRKVPSASGSSAVQMAEKLTPVRPENESSGCRLQPDGDRLDILSTLVASYEQKALPIDLPDAVEAIKFRMDQQELKPKDLEPMIGQRNRVYEVLTRKRPLPLATLWRLHTELGIPAESLIRQPV